MTQAAEQHAVKPAQIARAWLLNTPGTTSPIVGTSNVSRLEEAAAAEEINLSDEEIVFLEEPYQSHEILEHNQDFGLLSAVSLPVFAGKTIAA